MTCGHFTLAVFFFQASAPCRDRALLHQPKKLLVNWCRNKAFQQKGLFCKTGRGKLGSCVCVCACVCVLFTAEMACAIRAVRVARWCGLLQCAIGYCSVLQCAAMYCSELQCL